MAELQKHQQASMNLSLPPFFSNAGCYVRQQGHVLYTLQASKRLPFLLKSPAQFIILTMLHAPGGPDGEHVEVQAP